MPRILVLEDTPARQQAFIARFPDCVMVSRYAEAIAVLQTLRFDIVYLDFDIEFGRNGGDVAYFMAYEMPKELRPGWVVVHSSNRAGNLTIFQVLRRGGFNVEQSPYPPWTE